MLKSNGIFLMLLGMFLFALQDALFKFLTDTQMSLFQIYSIRSFFCILTLIIIIKIFREKVTFLKTHYPFLSILRVICWFMAYTTFFVGLSIMSLADAVTLFFVSPLFIFIFSKILYKSVISLKSWLALFVGFVGVYILTGASFRELDFKYLLPLFAASFYAMAMVITKITSIKDTAFQQLMHFQLFGFILGGLISLILSNGELNIYKNDGLIFLLKPWSPIKNIEIFYILLLAFLNLSASMSVIFAYRISDPPKIAIFEYNYLFWSICLSILIWGDFLSYNKFFGLVLIVFSGIFIIYRQTRLVKQNS